MVDALQTRALRKPVAIAVAALLLLALGGFIGGKRYGASLVQSRLDKMADAAGLKLAVQDIDVSLLGKVRVAALKMTRSAGTDVLSVDEAVATISPFAALRGSRRPHSISVTGLKFNLLVEDGKPSELLNLYRALRSSTPRKRPTVDKSTTPKRGVSIQIDGGEITLTMRGRGASALPKGLGCTG